MNIGPTELLIVLAIVLLIFGSTRLPKLARSMGQASKEFREGTRETSDARSKEFGDGTRESADGRSADVR